jgi:serine/threonine protein kinase
MVRCTVRRAPIPFGPAVTTLLSGMPTASHIGHYRLDRVLGSGSFATVWLAHDERLDAAVAVKVLADNWARNPEVRRRFIDEARLLRRIDDDRVIRVHVVDELPDGRPYFVMTWADRGTLWDRIGAARRSGPVPLDEVVATTVGIADCLTVVHAYGVVHRDIKPSNVLFRSLPSHQRSAGRDEMIVLADFGLAKSTAGASGFTLVAGTPAYMSPEQAEPAAILDVRADLYSLTAVLYELLTGRAAFAAESLGDVRSRRAPPPLAHLRPDVPAGLQSLVDRGLADDPAQRFASARDLVAALRAVTLPGPVPVRAGDPGETVPSEPPTPVADGDRHDAPGGPPGLPARPRPPRPGGWSPPPPRSAEPEIDVVDVVDALVGRAASTYPGMAPTWDAATTALRRPLRVGATAAAASLLPPTLLGVGDIEVVAGGSEEWPDVDVLVVAGPGPWPGSGRIRPAPSGPGPVRVLVVHPRSAAPVDSALPVRGLDPHHGWTAGPTVAGDMAAWLVTDTDRWAPAVRAGEALALVERAVQTVRTDPAGRELAGTVEQLRLVHPVLGDIGALRAEAAGELGLPADARRELRTVLTPPPPRGPSGRAATTRVPAAGGVAPEDRSGHWRRLVNSGRVPYPSRWAAEAVARAYDRLAGGTGLSVP